MDGDRELKKGRLKTNDLGEFTVPYRDNYSGAKLSFSFRDSEDASVAKIMTMPTSASASNSIQFFPEGGSLLASVINNVAMKATRPDGLAIAAEIVIKDANQEILAQSATNELGMGALLFRPTMGETFRAYVTVEDGTQIESELPAVVESGYSLRLNVDNNTRVFGELSLSSDKLTGQDIYFMTHYQGQVYHVSKVSASKEVLPFSIPKANLPTGVITLSVLNEQLSPLLERPFFAYSEESLLPISLLTDKKTAGLREKIILSLTSGLPTDSLRHALLSAAVINSSKISTVGDVSKDSFSILTQLLLSSDIRGYIERPSFYFEDDLKATDLEYLLLTQGWRKIDLNNLDDQVVAPDFAAEKALSIRGFAKKLGRKAPSPEAKMVLVPTHNFMDYIDTVANEEGYFEFNELVFPDSIKFLITAEDKKGKRNIDISLIEEESPSLSPHKNRIGELNDLNNLFSDELKHAKQYFGSLESQGLMEKAIRIEDVTVTARVTKKASEYSSNLNGPGNADQIITAEDLKSCPTLEMCLQGRLMGVMFQNGKPVSTRGGGVMQVIMDGMYVEADQLSMISAADVESVEVLRNINYTAIYGSYGGNGLIVVTTKRGGSTPLNYTPRGILTALPKGLHIAKTFYKPIYEVDSTQKLNRDLRTTIHWEPNIITDKDGKATFDFYTADEAGKYLITIEGLDLQGRLARKLLEIEVKE